MGHGKDSQIGAAMVLFRDGVECRSLRKHLGGKEHQTVFEAELIKAEGHIWLATIGVDGQAAVLTTTHGRGAPGQYLATGFHQQIAVVQHKHPGIEIEVRWTPGHEGILGNESVDVEAKRAAKGGLSEERQLPRLCSKKLLISCLAACQSHRRKVHIKAKSWFESSPRCQWLWKIDPTIPSSNFRKDTQDLLHWQASLLVQMRTGHIPLQ